MQGAGRHDGADRPEATNHAFARHTPWPRPQATKADDTPLTLSASGPSLGETDLQTDQRQPTPGGSGRSHTPMSTAAQGWGGSAGVRGCACAPCGGRGKEQREHTHGRGEGVNKGTELGEEPVGTRRARRAASQGSRKPRDGVRGLRERRAGPCERRTIQQEGKCV